MNPINTPRMARTLHPDMLFDEALFAAEQKSGLPVRLIYLALHSIADREGRFPWGARMAKLLTLDSDQQVLGAMAVLKEIGKIQLYRVNEEEFGAINHFARLQHINPRERQSVLPAPPAQTIEAPQEIQNASVETPALESPVVQNSGTAVEHPDLEPESPAMGSNGDSEFELPGEHEKEVGATKKAKKSADNEVIEGFRFKRMHGDTFWRTNEALEEDLPVIVSQKGDMSDVVAIFPVTGGSVKNLGISEAKVRLYDDVYPNADNVARTKKAAMWAKDNPAKRKTPQGLMRFINNWMSNSQNSGDFILGSNGLAVTSAPRGVFVQKPSTDDRIKETADRMHGLFGRKPAQQTEEKEVVGEKVNG